MDTVVLLLEITPKVPGNAPKIRAMQIIAELEGTTRGPYGGCVGYFSFNGNLDTCITIRTALRFPHVPHPACGHPLPSDGRGTARKPAAAG